MTTVLIAVDESQGGVEAAKTAHRLFGDEATYFVMNVGSGVDPSMLWGHPYPLISPALGYPAVWAAEPPADGRDPTPIETAETRADDVVRAAGLEATSLGDVGDPVDAILKAGEAHDVDVIVIASHKRGWLDRLFSGSVESGLMKQSTRSVLVIK